jgi:hypothetical protein
MCRMETFRTLGVHLVAVQMTTNRQLPVTQLLLPRIQTFSRRVRARRELTDRCRRGDTYLLRCLPNPVLTISSSD